MRRGNGFVSSVSFLDVLCNAMAAILIVAIIQLNPGKSASHGEGGKFLSVRAELQGGGNRCELEMLLREGDQSVFSEVAQSGPYRFLHGPGTVTLVLLRPASQFVQLYVFVREPIADAPGALTVVVNSSAGSSSATLELNAANDYRQEVPRDLLW